MVKNVVIDEVSYKNVKNKMGKSDDFFSKNEFEILMQFLMQRERKVIKNEVKL